MALARGLHPATPRLLSFCVGALTILPCLAQRWPRRRLEEKKFQPAVVPWKTDYKWNSTGRKHHWCDQDKALVEGLAAANSTSLGMSFRHGLENRSISVVFMQNAHYIDYDEEAGAITGGYFPEIIEEAASRAGFHWRNSFAYVPPPDGSKKETYDQWIAWAVFNYDLVVGDFSATEQRTSAGLRFGFPILDESPVLASVFKNEDPPWYESAFAFHRPFAPNLWITILVGMALTATVYLVVESDHGEFDEVRHQETAVLHQADGIGHSLWLTTISFTGGGTLLPHTGLGKTVSLTWTFLVLLITAAYTANLASQLVVETVATAPIKSVQDAIARNIPICVYKGGAFDQLIQDRYPELAVKHPKVWGYDNVRKGKCGAIVKDRMDFDIDKGKKSANPYCDLDMVGEAVVTVDGGFVTNHDSSTWCSNMVIDIISVALHDMYNDGWLEDAKFKLMARSHDQSCVPASEQGSSTSALTLIHFAGMFSVHVGVCLLSLCLYAMRRPSSNTRRTATLVNSYERAAQ